MSKFSTSSFLKHKAEVKRSRNKDVYMGGTIGTQKNNHHKRNFGMTNLGNSVASMIDVIKKQEQHTHRGDKKKEYEKLK